jgi:hypothetical protein
MEPFYIRFYNWLLVRVPVIPFPLGVFFLVVYLKSHSLLALGACKLSFGIFLLMPAWYLTFRPDLSITLLNVLYNFFFHSRSTLEPSQPLFKRTNWKKSTRAERIRLIVIAVLGVGFGLKLIFDAWPILF